MPLEDASSINISHYCYSGGPLHQGLCGSCYGIASADLVSITLARYSLGSYERLSAQQIVSESPYTYGCMGGSFNSTLFYISNIGLSFNSDYPYSNTFQEKALPAQPVSQEKITIKSYKNISSGDCNDIFNELINRPLVVGVTISIATAFYSTGTLILPNGVLNHGVVLVGHYDALGYLVKNSWGGSWGSDGFAWIDSGDRDLCLYAYSVELNGEGDPEKSCT